MKSNQIFITLRRLNPASKVSVEIKSFYIRIVFEVRKGAGNIKIAFHASTAFKDIVWYTLKAFRRPRHSETAQQIWIIKAGPYADFSKQECAVQMSAFYAGRGMRIQRKPLWYSRFQVKKNLHDWRGKRGWGCDRSLLVRTFKAILTLRVHRIMDVDYQTDRPFFCYKNKICRWKIWYLHNICSKHSWWVFLRTTVTERFYLCFGAGIRNIM